VEDAGIEDEDEFWSLLKAFNLYLDKNIFEMFYDEHGKIKIKEFIEFYS